MAENKKKSWLQAWNAAAKMTKQPISEEFPDIRGVRYDYEYPSLSAALPGCRPGGNSRYESESSYMKKLFAVNLRKSSWGVSAGVYVDNRDHTLYFVATQYDGQIAAQTWYLDKVKITVDDASRLAKAQSTSVYDSFVSSYIKR